MVDATVRKMKAVLLLGHGSKRKEANDTLKEIATAIGKAAGYGAVVPAYLQLAEPDIKRGVEIIDEMGFTDVIVMPYFLYDGMHVTADIPAEIDEAKKVHPAMTFSMARGLGYHGSLVKTAVERIEECIGGAAGAPVFSQHPIEKESFDIVSSELGETRFSALELSVVKRAIHTTADFEYKDMLYFSPLAVEAGIAAIRGGCNIITDVTMVESGITKARITPFGATVICFSADKDIESIAANEGITKTAASMRKAVSVLPGSIAVIGNAPTALFELLKLISSGVTPPALVIGVPVGFVGAADAKDALIKSGVRCITVRGRKGGSTVAAAIVNAISIGACSTETK